MQVRARGPIAFVVVAAAASVVSCTFLVSFDNLGDAACESASCNGSFDATVDLEGGAPEGATFTDAEVSSDAGDCSLLAEGEPCAKPDTCRAASTCHDGACTAHPVTDGTVCGTVAVDTCRDPPVCMAGVCAPPAASTDGTSCGAPMDKCHLGPLCMGGACRAAANAADGTTCLPAPDSCHDARKCEAGTCAAAADLADGTSCGAAPDSCHHPHLCASGTCAAPAAFAEGAVPTGGAAHERCCSGKAVDTATDKGNCGVCGIACNGGQTCGELDGAYLCLNCADNDECWSGCCSINPAPNHCSASECTSVACKAGVCPDGAHCVASTVDYCTY